jgi:hypothetical protein
VDAFPASMPCPAPGCGRMLPVMPDCGDLHQVGRVVFPTPPRIVILCPYHGRTVLAQATREDVAEHRALLAQRGL